MKGWIGFDLDGTIAFYNGWKGETHIGEPIPATVQKVKEFLANGVDVRIFTARVAEAESNKDGSGHDILAVIEAIENWCEKHIGRKLPITNKKDFGMIEFWDDRAVQVIPNTGMRADGGAPIDMILICPNCGTQHIDQPQPEKNWTNPPHRSHECQHCDWVWRPADVTTNGVEKIQTKGKADK